MLQPRGVFGTEEMRNCGITQKNLHLSKLHHLCNIFQDSYICQDPTKTQLHQETAPNDSWVPPPQGHIKCNIDATLFKDINSFGIGLCFRNHYGDFIVAKKALFAGTPKVIEAESWAHYQAIQLL